MVQESFMSTSIYVLSRNDPRQLETFRQLAPERSEAHDALPICIMDTLYLLARYHGTGELHEHEYLRLVAQRSTTVGDLPAARPGKIGSTRRSSDLYNGHLIFTGSLPWYRRAS